MKKLKSITAFIAAVSLFTLTATSCEQAKPDGNAGVTPDSPAVTAGEGAADPSAAQDSASDASAPKTTTADGAETGKPPKMDENASNEDAPVPQKTVDESLTLSLPDVEASAGEEVTFKVDLSDNSGLTTLITWIDFNKEYFEYVSAVGGDADDEENEDSVMYSNITFNTFEKEDEPDKTTLVCLYLDGSQQSFRDNTTFATVTLKVKDDTPAGKYDLSFDTDLDGDGAAMCNDYDRDTETLLIRTPVFKNGSITVK
jgi:hypothetical protein